MARPKNPENMQEDVSSGILVHFNCTTQVHMIPDEKYEKEKETLEKMRYHNYKDFQQRLAAGSPFELKVFKNGDEAYIPEWYYMAHKNDQVKISISIDKMTDDQGNRMPFKGTEAVKHGYINKATDVMKIVKRFHKVEEAVTLAEGLEDLEN